jgi:cobyrinic acid a,c-diamide synthase
LAEAYASADFVLVEGRFADAHGAAHLWEPGRVGGSLESLAHRLDLPRIIVLDAAQVADCRLPPRPDAIDGVILDGVAAREQFVRMQICVEGAWGVPIVAATERDEGLRQRLVSLPRGRSVPDEVVETLVARMIDYVQFNTLLAIAERTTLPQPSHAVPPTDPQWTSPPTVALAYDDAFCGYFCDVLERLEQLGANVVDFSPLGDEGLPDGADVVLIGCGRPENFAEPLAANHCMRAALRDFARRGGAIYSEGGGSAYLSRAIRLEDGRMLPMVDALPLTAVVLPEMQPFEPVEFVVRRNGPLGARGTTLRGYRGGCYRFEQADDGDLLTVELPNDLYTCGNVVGGRLQLHFVAQPSLLQTVFEPRDRNREGVYAGVG